MLICEKGHTLNSCCCASRPPSRARSTLKMGQRAINHMVALSLLVCPESDNLGKQNFKIQDYPHYHEFSLTSCRRSHGLLLASAATWSGRLGPSCKIWGVWRKSTLFNRAWTNNFTYKKPKTIKISKLFPLHFSILQASKLDFGFISYSAISIQFILIFLEVILWISMDYFQISMGPSTPSLPAVVKSRRIPMTLNYSLG